MHMLKPVLSTDPNIKERHSFNSPADLKHLNQENKSQTPKTYVPYHHKYPHGIGLSLKTTENQQTAKTPTTTNVSQDYFDGYLQKVIKANLEKITQIRTDHERERQNLLHQILLLKTENTLLKAKLQEQTHSISKSQVDKSKQLSHSQQKRASSKTLSQKPESPNPERQQQKENLIKTLKEKIQVASKEVEEYKKRNSTLSLQRKNLNLTIEKLQKQSQEKLQELEKYRRIEQNLTKELNEARGLLEITKIDFETEKSQLVKQVERLRREKVERKEKEKQKQRKAGSPLIMTEENIGKGSYDHKSSMGDKRVIKHLENQIKQRQAQICDRNTLIVELNEKIMSSALLGLNTKYKYLSKP